MPQWYGSPAEWATASLSRNGTPRNGPSGSGPAAVARADSNRGVITALSAGFRASIRAMAASTSSVGVISPRRTRSACAVASSHASASVIASVMPGMFARRGARGVSRRCGRRARAGGWWRWARRARGCRRATVVPERRPQPDARACGWRVARRAGSAGAGRRGRVPARGGGSRRLDGTGHGPEVAQLPVAGRLEQLRVATAEVTGGVRGGFGEWREPHDAAQTVEGEGRRGRCTASRAGTQARHETDGTAPVVKQEGSDGTRGRTRRRRRGVRRHRSVRPDVADCVIDRQVLGPADIEERIGLTGGHIVQGEILPQRGAGGARRSGGSGIPGRVVSAATRGI